MNIPAITKLTALAATLTGKKLKLHGVTLNLGDFNILTRHGKPSLHVEMSLHDTPHAEQSCDCPVCTMSDAIPAEHAAEVIGLLCQGASDSFILDSSFLSEDGFHIKIRHLQTGAITVGHGGNIAIAIGHAVTAALAS